MRRVNCRCGRRYEYDRSEAGQVVTCECGRVVEFPIVKPRKWPLVMLVGVAAIAFIVVCGVSVYLFSRQIPSAIAGVKPFSPESSKIIPPVALQKIEPPLKKPSQREIEVERMKDADDELAAALRQADIRRLQTLSQGRPVAADTQAMTDIFAAKVAHALKETESLKRIIAAGEGTPDDERRIKNIKSQIIDEGNANAASLGYQGLLSDDIKRQQGQKP